MDRQELIARELLAIALYESKARTTPSVAVKLLSWPDAAEHTREFWRKAAEDHICKMEQKP